MRPRSSCEQLLVLRHASAGRKLSHAEADFGRGLDPAGVECSDRLSEIVSRYSEVRTILSSPFRRCVQTVEPLARSFDLVISEDERLTPKQSVPRLRRALLEIPVGTLVCTHGEVIKRLLDVRCEKGAFWIVEHRRSRLVPIRYVDDNPVGSG